MKKSARRAVFVPGKAIFLAINKLLPEKLTKRGEKIAAGEAF